MWRNPFVEDAVAPTTDKSIRVTLHQALGDTIVATAAIRCFAEQHRDCKISVDSPFPDVFFNNPFVCNDPEARKVRLDNNLIQQTNQQPVHFMENYCRELARQGFPTTLTRNRPDLHLSESEKRRSGLPTGRYALVNAGRKNDFQTKHWGGHHFQELVDMLPEIQFIQVGHSNDYHPRLNGAIDFVGYTSIRDLMRLVYHSDFGVGPISALHHIYGAFQKPYVCLAGGLETPAWEQYPTAVMFSAVGKLPCCKDGGCWRGQFFPSKGPACALPVLSEGKDPVPFCLQMVEPSTVAQTIRGFYQSGLITRGERLIIPDRILPEAPTVGLCISTYGSVPFVHLALAAARRFNGDELKILVVDDASKDTGELAALCERYRADFISNPFRLQWQQGDIAAFGSGITWGAASRLDLVVKMSRRFIPLRGWVQELQKLAQETQYASYSNVCRGWGYGFRSECVGMSVKRWATILDEIRDRARVGMQGALPEAVIHEMARTLHIGACNQCREYERHHQPQQGEDGYCKWGLLGTSRKEKSNEYLWHESASPKDYSTIAQTFGINYSLERWANV